MRIAVFLLMSLLPFAAWAGTLAPKPAAAPDDLLCEHAPAGTRAPIPTPFERWLVVVCARDGQALVPVDGMLWTVHRTEERVSILALPPDAAPPGAASAPRYDIRFTAFYAVEATDEKRIRAMKRLKLVLGDEPMPAADHIFQMDALSSVGGLRYNIYFYVQGATPRIGLVCIDKCRRALILDIRTTKSGLLGQR